MEEAAKHPVLSGKFTSQERAPNYPIALVWVASCCASGSELGSLTWRSTTRGPRSKCNIWQRHIILLLDRRRVADVRTMQRNEGSEERLMITSESVYLVMDAGCPVAAFTVKREMRAYVKRRLGTFTNPLVYAFGGNQGYTPTIMTMSSVLAEM
jgi:hypothetical protein